MCRMLQLINCVRLNKGVRTQKSTGYKFVFNDDVRRAPIFTVHSEMRFLNPFPSVVAHKKTDCAYVYMENPFMCVVYCLRSEHAPRRHNIIASWSMNLKIN